MPTQPASKRRVAQPRLSVLLLAAFVLLFSNAAWADMLTVSPDGVLLKDGKVRYIDGNRRHPVNRGVICGKGAAGIMQHYSPARLRAPVRTGTPPQSGRCDRA